MWGADALYRKSWGGLSGYGNGRRIEDIRTEGDGVLGGFLAIGVVGSGEWAGDQLLGWEDLYECL